MDARSPVAGIMAALALIVVGVFAPAWPITAFGGLVLIIAITALGIRMHLANEAEMVEREAEVWRGDRPTSRTSAVQAAARRGYQRGRDNDPRGSSGRV
jgi:uncharacterized membrane protein